MDPYVYPGTDVLKNLRDIHDDDLLSKLEMDMTSRRVAELEHAAQRGKLDIPHLQSIHRHIFQDVYAWAGEFRTVDIARPGQFYFAFAHMIAAALHNAFEGPRGERHLAGMDRERFSARAGHYLGELNAIHPFRDGNGRTQREFIRQPAERAGYTLEWRRVTRAEMYDASHRSFQRGDSTGLGAAIGHAIA